MARPVKDDSERLKKNLPPIRCTEGEFAAIQSRAAQAGMTMSAFVRQMALKGKIVIQENSHDFAVADQLRRIGININQQTRIANATGEFPPELHRLWRRLERILDDIIKPA